MKILFIYPSFERYSQSHPELQSYISCNEYIGPPSLGIASIAACTPPEMEVNFIDDRINPVNEYLPEADLYALSFFTPAATRAMEIGKMLKERKKPVVMGGMFPTIMPEEVAPYCNSVVIGEGEPVWAQICKDAASGCLQPLYQAKSPVSLDSLPVARVELYLNEENDTFSPVDYPLQLSRGCPFTCNACSIPPVMGRKIRFFPERYIWELIKKFSVHNKVCSLTEDTSTMFVSEARNRFRAFLRKVAKYREMLNIRLSYLATSIPMILNMDKPILEEIQQAGFVRFYLVCGFDPITRNAFGRGNSKAMTKAEECIQRCHHAGIEPYVSFLAGNDEDDEGIFDRTLEFTLRTKISMAEFVVATPYPGSPLWKKLLAEKRIIDYTWKRYNDANVVFQPAKMSPEHLQEGYLTLWREFYSNNQDLKNADRVRKSIHF
jgi:radical SAM superfamily enzyme YgiQ (UPF0313 family)